jgi:cell division protein FtsQ
VNRIGGPVLGSGTDDGELEDTRLDGAAFDDADFGAAGEDAHSANRFLDRPLVVPLLVLMVLIVAAGGWAVGFSSLLGAKTVSVRGNLTITTDRVRTVAAVKKGTPLIRLDSAAIERRVEKLPAVASATVHASYPSTVTITVVERVALGYLKRGSGFVLMDKTGRQFRTVTAEPRGLPLFAVPGGAQAAATGAAVADVAESLTPALRAQVISVEAFDPSAITLLLTDRRIVRWGSAARSADKAVVLPTLLARGGTQIDLTDPDQPFTR